MYMIANDALSSCLRESSRVHIGTYFGGLYINICCFSFKGEAIGKPGSRVPYQRGNFTVEGLPEGVTFKKPYCYGAQQCKSIVEAADSISFKIQSEPADEQSGNNEDQANIQPASLVVNDEMMQRILQKVASDVNVEDIVSGRKRLSESDINVEDCTLTQDERLILYTKCRDYFDQEAWVTVGHNTKDMSRDAKDLIFPLYTEAEDEDFWLFYCQNQTLFQVENARPSAKLKGYWLDLKETGDKYSILPALEEIKVISIVKNDHGPLYYEKSLNVNSNDDDVVFELPDIFKNCIRVTLQNYGLLRR